MWGVMIGEMFDLEVYHSNCMQFDTVLSSSLQALAKQCKDKDRWSFFFMSTPMNVSGARKELRCLRFNRVVMANYLLGGVASLANSLAIH